MEQMELYCFQIISAVGEAKSLFIEAMQNARSGNRENAEGCIKDGNDKLIMGHKIHASLIQKEAKGEQLDICLLLIHAEDQLMNAETCKLQAEEFLYVYERMNKEA